MLNLVGQIVARADPNAFRDLDLKAGFVTLTKRKRSITIPASLERQPVRLLSRLRADRTPGRRRYAAASRRSSAALRSIPQR